MKNIDEMKSFDVNERRLIDGPTNSLMALAPLKHQWARDMWRLMLNNTWHAPEIDLSRDKAGYLELTDGERKMFDRSLAFLSNLDGIQFNNLTFNIGHHITSPEVSMCISRQAWEEANHVDSYLAVIDAITDDPVRIYTMFANNSVLQSKNEYILEQSNILKNEYSADNFARAIVANILLEGVYFNTGFLSFYTLARMGKMTGSADMIRLIHRDEDTHCELFSLMYETLKNERPELFTPQFYRDVDRLFEIAVELECTWGAHIIEDGVLGLTPQIIADRVKFLADKRRARLGLPLLYNVKNPTPWADALADKNGVETNFFEGKVTTYQTGGALAWGDDDE